MSLPTLQLGAESDFVTQLRKRLATLGFAINIETTMPHVYDSAVQAAVSAFKQSVGLPADGVVDAPTWVKLGADPNANVLPAPAGGMGALKVLGALAAAYFGYRYVQKRGGFGKLFSSVAGYGTNAVDDSDFDDYAEDPPPLPRRSEWEDYPTEAWTAARERREGRPRLGPGRESEDVTLRLIEEPLALLEQRDCEGASRMLMRRMAFATVKGTPKHQEAFRKVARKVAASCERDLAPLVEQAVRAQIPTITRGGRRVPVTDPDLLTAAELAQEAAISKSIRSSRNWEKSLTDLNASRIQRDALKWIDDLIGRSREFPQARVLPTVRRASAHVWRQAPLPWREEVETLLPEVRGSRGGKIVYVDRDARVPMQREIEGRTVGPNDPDSSYVMIEGRGFDRNGNQIAVRKNIPREDLVAFIPRYIPPRAERTKKVMTAEENAANALRVKVYKATKKAEEAEAKKAEEEAKKAEEAEAKRLEHEARRRTAHLRNPSGAAAPGGGEEIALKMPWNAYASEDW